MRAGIRGRCSRCSRDGDAMGQDVEGWRVDGRVKAATGSEVCLISRHGIL
jgi:hypothetical protein